MEYDDWASAGHDGLVNATGMFKTLDAWLRIFQSPISCNQPCIFPGSTWTKNWQYKFVAIL